MPASDATGQWIERVLGVQLAEVRANAAGVPKAMPIWREAREAADRQIAELAKAFSATRHPLGQMIADRGLPTLTKNTLVALTAALFDYDSSEGKQKDAARAKASAALAALEQTVLGSPALDVLAQNPFGVTVTLRQTLGEAAQKLAATLSAR